MNEVRPRVLHVISSIGIGGAERHVLDLCMIQQAQNLRVCVALPQRGALSDMLTQAGIAWVVFGRGGRLNPFTLVRLWRVIRAYRPNVIHAHMPRSISMVSRVRGAIPLIATAHNLVKNPRPFARCDGVICVSQQVHDSLTALGFRADRAVVVHNAIKSSVLAPDARAATRQALGWQHELIMLCVARLVPAKGQSYAIRAMPNLLAQEPNLRLVLVGAGPDELKLKQEAQALGVDKQVALIGERRDVPYLLKAADIYLQPSIKEGFCIAFLEAMRAGLPCIGTRTGAIPEMLENPSLGVLIDPADSRAIESAVRHVLSAPDQAAEMAEQASAFAAEQFSQERQGRDTYAAYARVIPFALTHWRDA
ncbi:MAG: glycosyltransferase [Halothiobacillus sp.]